MNKDFENWWFNQNSVTFLNLPMGTELLYGVCNEDTRSFNLVNKYLELAFEAGYEAGKNEQN